MKRRFFAVFGENGLKRSIKMSFRAGCIEKKVKTVIIGITVNTGYLCKTALETRFGKRGIKK